MPLKIQTGHATAAGVRPHNEDFTGMVTPSGEELARKGALVAIADGVSGHAGGREAAEYSVRGLLTDYYATPDTWETTVALERVLEAINRWVIAQAQLRREVAGMATTLTAIVFRGQRAVWAHVGDTRAYCYRKGVLKQLTVDHVWDRPDMSHVLTRGIGLDSQVRVDFGDVPLHTHDRFVLCSDGVWGHLNPERISQLAASEKSPQLLADALVAQALAQGSQDNASAIVVDIAELPEDALGDVLASLTRLPVPSIMSAGMQIDGFRIAETLRQNTTNILYKVEQMATGRLCVLKTLIPERGDDPAERKQLAHEEWIARRVVARFFPQVIPLDMEQRSALYFAQTWHDGHTLAQALAAGRHFTIPDLLAIAIKLARGVGALHRRSVIHRDIKPENIHLGEDGEVRILDFGVAESGFAAGILSSRAGTPSFLAPELFTGAPASAQTDLYALGVTLYYALARRYPYGEIEPFQRPRFGEPVPPTRYRPDIPAWLENIVLKAVSKEQRFETAEELLLALERGAARPLEPPRPTPLAQQDPATLWRAVALLSLVVNALLIYWLLVVP
jgi:serine/threonine protein phosphatase PrpC